MNAQNPMISAVAVAGIAPVAPTGGSSEKAQSRLADEADRAARYRLVIEEGPREGRFIYKMLDRVTGEVVRQLPREEVVELAARASYDAGDVVDTRA